MAAFKDDNYEDHVYQMVPGSTGGEEASDVLGRGTHEEEEEQVVSICL